jgi:hypothetical protein
LMYSSTQNHSLDTLHRAHDALEARAAKMPNFYSLHFAGKSARRATEDRRDKARTHIDRQQRTAFMR